MGTPNGFIYFATGILPLKNINAGYKHRGDDKKKGQGARNI
jgi:hypothetical protein